MIKKYQIVSFCARIFVLPLLITGALSSCIGNHSPKCAELAKKHKLEKEYAENHKPSLSKIKIYVENSGSMDGYVNGNTEFKTNLFNTIKLLKSESTISKYFINRIIVNKDSASDESFTNGLSPQLLFDEAGKNRAERTQNRANSNIAELIEKVIELNKRGEVSIFISDCVFDPHSDPDIQKRLAQQKTTIQTAIKKKLKYDDEFSVVVYKLMSSFTGTYYNKVRPHQNLNNEQRPYYMWFFGDAYQLAKVRELLKSDIESRVGTKVFAETNFIKNIPYKCPAAKCNYAKGKHIDEPREKDGKFSFNIYLDLSTLPLTQEYLASSSNYRLPENKDYTVKSVDEYSKKDKTYTHELKVTKNKGNIKEQTIVLVELQRSAIPSWVDESNDPSGSDYLNGNRPNKARTFGLSSYISGVHDAFGDTPFANFVVLIK